MAARTKAHKLTANVIVDDVGYGPAYGNEGDVPPDVAERIGDHAWSDTADKAD